MTAKRITFTYGATLEVEVDTEDYDDEDDMVEAAWAEFGPECGDQSPGYDSYIVEDGALQQVVKARDTATEAKRGS